MPVSTVRTADGRLIDVEHPEGATDEAIMYFVAEQYQLDSSIGRIEESLPSTSEDPVETVIEDPLPSTEVSLEPSTKLERGISRLEEGVLEGSPLRKETPEEKARRRELEELTSFSGYVGAMGSTFSREFGKSLLSAGSGLARLADIATDRVGLEDLIDSGDENALIYAANEGKRFLDDKLGVGEEYQDSWLVDFSGGLGQIASFFVPGGALKAAGYLTKGTGRAATVGTGAGFMAEDQAQRIQVARDQGKTVTEDQEDLAIALSGALGTTEAITPLGILKKLRVPKNNKELEAFKENSMNRIASALRSGRNEAIQEVLAGVAQDAIQFGIYDEDASIGDTWWDDLTIGGGSAALIDYISTGVAKRRSALTRDIEVQRERELRAEEAQQLEQYYDQAEAQKKDLQKRKARADLSMQKEFRDLDKLVFQEQQQELEDLAVSVDFTQPYKKKTRSNQYKDQAAEYANQIARDLTQKANLFPDFGIFEVKEESAPGGPNFTVYHSDTNQQFGQPFKDLEFALHLSQNLNQQLVDRGTNRVILDAIDASSDNYSDPTRESVYAVGQRVARPKSHTISSALLNEAAGTTDGPTSPYQEGLDLDTLHTLQYGVPPYTDRGQKFYKDLSNLTVSQQINLDRQREGLPAKNDFTLQEAKEVLGDKFPKVFDLLVESRQEAVAPVGDFGEVGRRLEASRRAYQEEKRTREEVDTVLKDKNIISGIDSPEVKYIFERITAESDINNMSPSQRMYLVGELKRLPVIPEPVAIPDFSPKPFTKSQFETAKSKVISTDDGTIENIQLSIEDAGSPRRLKTVATAIQKELKKSGVILDDDTVSSPLTLPKPEDKQDLEYREEQYKEPAVSEEAQLLEKEFSKKLRGMGLDDIRLRVLDNLKGPGYITKDAELIKGKDPESMLGYYSVRKIFTALDTAQREAKDNSPEARKAALSEQLDHEVVHAVRDLDLWKESEWKTLENAVKTKMFPGTPNISFLNNARARYPNKSPVDQTEEAVAELVRYAQKDKSLVTGKPRAMINRMNEFFEKSNNAIKGAGFQNVNDVVRKLQSGEIGKRERLVTKATKTPKGITTATYGPIRTLKSTEEAAGAVPERDIGREIDLTGDSSVKLEGQAEDNRRAQAKIKANLKAVKKEVDDIVSKSPEGTIERINDEIALRPVLEEQQLTGTAPYSWQAKSYSKGDLIVYNVVDKLVGQKSNEDQINKSRVDAGLPPLTVLQSAVKGEEAIPGILGNEFREFEETKIKPFSKKLSDLGVTLEEMDEFLALRHAVERNNKLALRDKSRDVERNPGSGQTKNGDRLTNSFVKATMDRRYGMKWNDDTGEWSGGNARAKNLQSLAEDLDSVVASTIDRKLSGDLITKNDARTLKRLYKYYAPLQGKAVEDDFIDNAVRSSGLTTAKKQMQTAFGRQSAAASPVGSIFANAQRAMDHSVKNKQFGQRLLNLVNENPNPEYWEAFSEDNPKYTQVLDKKYTYIGNDPSLQGQVVSSIPDGADPLDYIRQTTIQASPLAFNPRLILVKVDGKDHYIDIKTDDRLRKAIQSMDVGEADKLIRQFGIVNRWLSMMNTSLNPEFVIGNFSKDLQTAVGNIVAETTMESGLIKDQKKIVRAVLKDVIPSMGTFYKGLRRWNVSDGSFVGNLAGLTPKDQADFKEFMTAGAKADWFHSRSAEEQAQTIQNMIEMQSGTFKGDFKRRFTNVMQFVEDSNSAVENAVRFSTFKVARERLLDSGYSREEAVAQAASLAKNLTVNFNRKGMSGDLLNSIYLFFNASVQGTVNLLRGLNVFDRDSSRTKQGMVGSLIAFGALMAARAHQESEEDPQTGRSYYESLNDFEKERNMLIMKENGKDAYKIPLPYGYNVFYLTGVKLYEMNAGLIPPEKAASDLTSAFLGSFSPIGFSVVPTVGQPFYELAKNENYFGSPIYRENFPGATPVPDSQMTMGNTKTVFVRLAKFLNNLTTEEGEGETVSGWADLSPDSLEHLAEFAFGGFGAFGLRTFNALEKWAKGEDLEKREIPFLRRIEAEPSQYISVSDYFERKSIVQQKLATLQSKTGQEREAYRKRIKDSYGTMFTTLKNTENSLRRLRKRRRALKASMAQSPENAIQGASQLEAIEARIQEIYDDFNKKYDERVGRTK